MATNYPQNNIMIDLETQSVRPHASIFNDRSY